jgi:predicted DNA-binding antitoxin AbrB/MazE fold protein
MNPLVVDATFEGGVLKPATTVPLWEHAQVRITIEPKTTWADATYGMLGWKGTHEQLEQILADAEELP